MHYPFAGAVSVEVLVGTGNSASWTAKESFILELSLFSIWASVDVIVVSKEACIVDICVA